MTVSAFCGQKKVFLCTVANGRGDMRAADTFGMFVNTMSLSGEVDGQRADDFLKETDALETVSRGLLKDAVLSEIPLVDGENLQKLDDFNHFTQEVEEGKTVVDLFRKQALATPDATAVLFDGKAISYRELDEFTDALAARILESGLGEEDVVSVLIGRNTWMTKASLAAMKAGCG